ncbi:hypothetical protein F5144DRAFT_187199 [Chaetomium tenue]|uniref:Uncharacterized protein n=1 Tax=Chaetomium tenue TaxID=1854479 RepID=A0ACB7PC05_9PEZI|nr:hypothetical protein F5144DRAFT_187199 [Chaetomium globosum]
MHNSSWAAQLSSRFFFNMIQYVFCIHTVCADIHSPHFLKTNLFSSSDNHRYLSQEPRWGLSRILPSFSATFLLFTT